MTEEQLRAIIQDELRGIAGEIGGLAGTIDVRMDELEKKIDREFQKINETLKTVAYVQLQTLQLVDKKKEPNK